MSFCVNCGIEIVEGAKFCQKCGHPTNTNVSKFQRDQEYSGKIYKCPKCGEILKSFVMNCPACGHELRGVKASNAVKEFALKLEAIESKREYEKPKGIFATAEAQQRISKTDEQKISLIKSFSIPNSKEDMLEFMILATTNMNMKSYDSANTHISKGEKEINAAWYSKVQQVYEKAKRSYSSDDMFVEIKSLYNDCNEEIKKSKKKGIIKWILMFGWIPLVYFALIPALVIQNNNDNMKAEERLENTVIEIESSIDAENYRQALMYAELLVYDGHDDERERYWSVRQKYYVDEILEKAGEKGIKLNYVPIENSDEIVSETGSIGMGFSKGFYDALADSKEEIQRNIELFYENLNGQNSNSEGE